MRAPRDYFNLSLHISYLCHDWLLGCNRIFLRSFYELAYNSSAHNPIPTRQQNIWHEEYLYAIKKKVAINNRDIRSQCLTIQFYITCQSIIRYIRCVFLYRLFFCEQTRTSIRRREECSLRKRKC